MLCGWEGNRRSGVALAMRHRLSGLSTYGLKGLCAGDEHPAYAPLEHVLLYLNALCTKYQLHVVIAGLVHRPQPNDSGAIVT